MTSVRYFCQDTIERHPSVRRHVDWPTARSNPTRLSPDSRPTGRCTLRSLGNRHLARLTARQTEMRLLFISGTTVGGSGRSQRELALQLSRRGHTIQFLADDRRAARNSRWLYEQLSDASIRWSSGPVGPILGLRSLPGRRTRSQQIEGIDHHLSAIPQNALPSLLRNFRPDAIIASSLERWAWRLIHEQASVLGVPTVLYVREDDSLAHLDTGAAPTLLVANAESLATALSARGFECAFVPSVIDTSITATESSREVALAINPIPSRGSDLVWQVAERVPEVRFVVQESWPLMGREKIEVDAHVAQLPNVEFRSTAPPSSALYGDARVLLVPYRVDNRPRVIAEAQANGIPVIAAAIPALVEAIGSGGMTVPLDSAADWSRAIRTLWADNGLYKSLADAAREHSKRPDIDPAAVTESFERLIDAAVATTTHRKRF